MYVWLNLAAGVILLTLCFFFPRLDRSLFRRPERIAWEAGLPGVLLGLGVLAFRYATPALALRPVNFALTVLFVLWIIILFRPLPPILCMLTGWTLNLVVVACNGFAMPYEGSFGVELFRHTPLTPESCLVPLADIIPMTDPFTGLHGRYSIGDLLSTCGLWWLNVHLFLAARPIVSQKRP